MKKRIIWTALAIICAGQTAAQDSLGAPRLAPTADQAQTAYLSAQILGRYHYKSVPLDDAMSEKIFERYLKALDPERLFFTQADIDSFADARTRLDDAILRGNLSAPFTIFQRFEQRVTEREKDILGCLAGGLSNKLIARDLNIAEGTVKVHIKNLLKKLKFRSRLEAAVWAIEQGHRNQDPGSSR